jgi:endonuclease/exonuclease/phosphatase family metal-dependent hydrolase
MTVWRTAVAAGIGSLLLIFITILYYISTLITFPFPNFVLPIVAGILLVLAVLVNAQTVTSRDWRPGVVPLALLVVPIALLVTQPMLVVQPVNSSTFRLVNYNIHQAINPGGMVDPEAIAQVIEAQNPHVVVLQEVTRGWAISGSLDVAEWLSRRLKLPYYYAPAADGQFGNAILTSQPVVGWLYELLPRGGAPMLRSFLRADLNLGVGEPVTIINAHLHQIDEDTAIRIPQVERLVEVWADRPRTIIAGDMNARPGEDDISIFQAGGLISAQDVTGNTTLLTFNSVNPFQRIDWIFGSPDVEFSDFVIPETTASDHLPLAVTVILEE